MVPLPAISQEAEVEVVHMNRLSEGSWNRVYLLNISTSQEAIYNLNKISLAPLLELSF